MRKYSPKMQMFEGSKRFQLYKKLSTGELMHITSIESINLVCAIDHFKNNVENFSLDKYKVTGI